MTEPLYNWNPWAHCDRAAGYNSGARDFACADPMCGFVVRIPDTHWDKLTRAQTVFYCLAGHPQFIRPNPVDPEEVVKARDAGYADGYQEGLAEGQLDFDRLISLFGEARSFGVWMAEWVENQQARMDAIEATGQPALDAPVESSAEPDPSGAALTSRPEPPVGPAAPEGKDPEPAVPLDDRLLAFAATVDSFSPSEAFQAVRDIWSSASVQLHLRELVEAGRLEKPSHGHYRLPATPGPQPVEPPVVDPDPPVHHPDHPQPQRWHCPERCGQGPYVSRRLLVRHAREHPALLLEEYTDTELQRG